MGLLSKPDILKHKELGNIVIEPFEIGNLGTDSYDVRLGTHYLKRRTREETRLSFYNPFDENHVERLWELRKAKPAAQVLSTDVRGLKNILPDDLIILIVPGETILGHTLEFIGGRHCITTKMHARSSSGRNLFTVCKCAGKGDVGYINRWTMEVAHNGKVDDIPAILVVGMRLAQIDFYEVEPIEPVDSYEKRGKYQEGMTFEELVANWDPWSMAPRMYNDWEIQKGVGFRCFVPEEGR